MKTWQKYAIAIIPLVVIALLWYYFSDIVSYIIMAWVLSMIGAPLHRFFNRFMNSSLAAGFTLVVFILILILLLRIFIPPLYKQAKNLAGIDYERISHGLQEPVNDTKAWLIGKGLIQSEEEELQQKIEEEKHRYDYVQHVMDLDSLLRIQGDTLDSGQINLLITIQQPTVVQHSHEEPEDDYFKGIRRTAVQLLNPSQIPRVLSSLVGVFGGFIIAILSIFFIAFFFLREKGLFTRMVSFLVPNEQESKAEHAIEESSRMLIRYFVGLFFQLLILTIITTIVLKLFGFKNALLMSFCFAIFNLIPYIGPIIGNLVGVLIVISANLDVGFYDAMLPKIITAVIIFAVIQLIDNFLLQPNIFSKSVKAHPLEIFIVVLVGAKIGGVLGMVLAIPAYTVFRVVAKVFFSEFEIVKKMTRSM